MSASVDGVNFVEKELAEPQDAANGEFTALFSTCQRSLFLFSMSLLGNVADAEEVVQDCGLILWKKFHEFQPGTSFIHWACQVARFQALKVREKRFRGPHLFSNDFMASFAVAINDESLAKLELRREAFAECIKRLSPADRELIIRRYREGTSTREVAESLERSVQGTRRSLQRIREALAECVRRKLAREESE
jgi:RNA polymerase sigma-70 factor, ECF subfamily